MKAAPAEQELLDELWREVRRIDPSYEMPKPAPEPVREVRAKPGPAGLVHLPELLSLDGDAFIGAAYRALFGRAADPTGVAAVQAALAAGARKASILYSLRASPEGRLTARELPGLAELALMERLSRVPVAGRLLWLAMAVLRRLGGTALFAAWDRRRHRVRRAMLDYEARLDELSRRNEVLARALEDMGGAVDEVRELPWSQVHALSRKAELVQGRLERMEAAVRRLDAAAPPGRLTSARSA